MAQEVIINGVTYQNVPEVDIPKAGGGTAKFMDTSDATLSSGDQLLNGVTAYAGGTKITGNIPTKTEADLSVSGATVTVPAGRYASSVGASVASGSATAPASISGTSAAVSTGTNTLTLSKTISVTPVVSVGYVAAATAGNSAVSLTASIPTKAADTITPGTSDQSVASGTYLTGALTVKGDANLLSSNIIAGVTIFGVSGTATLPNISQNPTTKVLSIS